MYQSCRIMPKLCEEVDPRCCAQFFGFSFSHLRCVNFEIFSNHGGQFKISFSHLKRVNFEIFSNHSGQFKTRFSHLRCVNYKIFSNHSGQFKISLSHLRSVNYKIFSNHGGGQVLVDLHRLPLILCLFLFLFVSLIGSRELLELWG